MRYRRRPRQALPRRVQQIRRGRAAKGRNHREELPETPPKGHAGPPPAVRHCPTPHPLLGAIEARAEAARRRQAGEHVEASRCECGTWIVRVPLTQPELEALALRLRNLAPAPDSAPLRD